MNLTILSYRLTGILLSFLVTGLLSAQINDDCTTATPITDPSNFCSPLMAATNLGASLTPIISPSCFFTIQNDVWYSFTAVATDVVIVINGGSFFTPGGTLQQPGVALYSGICPDGLAEIDCAQDLANNVIELRTEDLIPGETYYFRVVGFTPGTFQYCIRNFFFGGEISGDCPTSVVLCDKSAFNVQAVAGPGTDASELDDAFCFQAINGELNSSWFVFTAVNNGALEFTLTPNNAADDLDFVVYRLPNGPGDCSGKIIERCMAAGDFIANSPCMGPTGLNATATDIAQPPGCLMGDDNFLKFMQLTAGATYALVVNNFTSSGNGFQIDWGGTSEFDGPNAWFEYDKTDSIICNTEQIIFSDSSTFSNGNIDDWFWSFGQNANIDTVHTQGPHTLQYERGGLKTVTLTIHTETGCEVSVTRQIQVDTCCTLSASVNVIKGEQGGPSSAGVSVENYLLPLQINWSNGQTDTVATDLKGGEYTVIVQDDLGCIDTVSFTVTQEIFKIPNAFTPNSDNINDTFFPVVEEAEVLKIEVWSRWGGLVYEGTNTGWDGQIGGKPAPADVYAYQIVMRHANGTEETFSGGVTLLR